MKEPYVKLRSVMSVLRSLRSVGSKGGAAARNRVLNEAEHRLKSVPKLMLSNRKQVDEIKELLDQLLAKLQGELAVVDEFEEEQEYYCPLCSAKFEGDELICWSCGYKRPADRKWARRLVDAAWQVATESTQVPSTKWADQIIDGVDRGELPSAGSDQSLPSGSGPGNKCSSCGTPTFGRLCARCKGEKP